MQHRNWLIAYDIASPRRLGRAHRFLRKRAFALQYSVFLARLGEQELRDLLAGLGRMIKPSVDDVRAYPLRADMRLQHLGADTLPHGIRVWLGHRSAGVPDTAAPARERE